MDVDPPRLTVIVPVYNESATLGALLERVLAEPTSKQVIVVDDGSADGSRAVAEAFAEQHPGVVEVACHPTNRGKGAAIRTAVPLAKGQYTIIQDADLEYDPGDYAKLLAAAEEQGVRVVYGSRVRARQPHSYRRFYWGGRLVSLAASVLYWRWITDEPTCYKLFATELLQSLPLSEDGFGFCAEATALVLRRGERLIEVPIRYTPRSIEQGKKIRWTDGARAVWVLLKLRFGTRR